MKKIAFSALAVLAVVATIGSAGQANANERMPFFTANSGGIQKTVVLNRHVIAYKLLEQGYSGFSGFRANDEDFTVHAVNAKGEAVLVHVHPALGIAIGEETVK